MSTFGIKSISQVRAKYPSIYEGYYVSQNRPSGSRDKPLPFHLINLGSRDRFRADFVLPERYPSLEFDQGFVCGLITDPEKGSKAKEHFKSFQETGKDLFRRYIGGEKGISTIPIEDAALISDGSNYPYNEGHFAVYRNRLMPMPTGALFPTGSHNMLTINENGNISFRTIALCDELWGDGIAPDIFKGFFAPKIIHEGNPVGLTDTEPGTDDLLISDFRGHIGQIFFEQDYLNPNDIGTVSRDFVIKTVQGIEPFLGVFFANPNDINLEFLPDIDGRLDSCSDTAIKVGISQILRHLRLNDLKRAAIHMQLLGYMRDSNTYRRILNKIIAGRSISFRQYGQIELRKNTYNHTYWIEAKDGSFYCMKTYRDKENDVRVPSGVTFEEGPFFLIEIAEKFGFKINNAFIGTNGGDVRIIARDQHGNLSPIDKTSDGQPIETDFARELGNFVVIGKN